MLFRDRPNSRAACRMLMPSTCTARLTPAYTSTLHTSQVSRKTLSSCNVLEPKCGGLLFDRHKTPFTALPLQGRNSPKRCILKTVPPGDGTAQLKEPACV